MKRSSLTPSRNAMLFERPRSPPIFPDELLLELPLEGVLALPPRRLVNGILEEKPSKQQNIQKQSDCYETRRKSCCDSTTLREMIIFEFRITERSSRLADRQFEKTHAASEKEIHRSQLIQRYSRNSDTTTHHIVPRDDES